MTPKVCPTCGQPLPQPEGRLICSQCGAPIMKGQHWTHGGDGRPRHKSCMGTTEAVPETMELLNQ